MRILMGFMGNSEHRDRYVYGDHLHATRFPICSIYEKYKNEKKPFDYVLVLGTEGTLSNRNEVIVNMLAIKNDDYELLDRVEQYITMNKQLPSVDEIIECKVDFVESVRVEEVANQQQLNDTFTKIDSLLEKYVKRNENVELVLDVTNGYRTQPLLGILVTNFVKRKYPNVVIENIWYGILDSQRGNNLIPIQKYNDFIDWAMGLQNYLDTGNTSILMNLVSNSRDEKAKNLVNELDQFSKRLKVGRNEEAKNSVQEVLKVIRDFKENPHNDEGIVLNSMLEKIEEKFKSFQEGFYFALIEWNYHHGDIQQALTVCVEFFPYVGYCHQMICENTLENNYSNENLDTYRKYKDLIINSDIAQTIIEPYDNKIKVSKYFNQILIKIKECIETLYNNLSLIDYCQTIIKCVYENQKPWKNLKLSLLQNYNHMTITHKYDYKIEINEETLDIIFRYFAYLKLENNEDINQLLNNIKQKYHEDTGKTGNFRLTDISYNWVNRDKASSRFIWLFKNMPDVANYLYQGPCQMKRCIELKEKDFNLNQFKEIIKESQDKKLDLKPSQYFIEHVDEVNNILHVFDILRKYRNDINHGGFEFTKKLNRWTEKTHTVEDFYEINDDEDNLKKNLDIIIEYMKKLEKINI